MTHFVSHLADFFTHVDDFYLITKAVYYVTHFVSQLADLSTHDDDFYFISVPLVNRTLNQFNM